jgi:hypothetical protein
MKKSETSQVKAYELLSEQPIEIFGSHDLNAIVISAVVDPIGRTHVLSQFGDDEWDMSLYFNQPNVSPSAKIIKWHKTCPENLVLDCKIAIYSWWKLGISGNKAPEGRSVCTCANSFGYFLRWISAKNINSFDQLNSFHLSQFRQLCIDEAVGHAGMHHRLHLLDLIWKFRDRLANPINFNPWGNSNLEVYCGVRGNKVPINSIGKTPAIPKTIQESLFIYCKSIIENSQNILNSIENGSLLVSNPKAVELRDAIYYIISISTGMRSQEVGGIEFGAGRQEIISGTVFCWIKSRELKTNKGIVEWLAPPITLELLTIVERYAASFQKSLSIELNDLNIRLSQTPPPPDINALLKRRADVEMSLNKVFIGIKTSKNHQISTLSHSAINLAYKRIAKAANVEWNLAPHQTRKTYARNWVESKMGRCSLIYLKDQFKHSSMSMTELYASNLQQDTSLYDDIFEELIDFKKEILSHLHESDSPLTGGAGKKILRFRGSKVRSKEQLVRNTAMQINIRPTGHGWCISQDLGCGGSGLYDATQCIDCKNGIIERNEHGAVWQLLYEQQKELLTVKDIGPAGEQRVLRDFQMMQRVLEDLNIPLEAPKTNEEP